MGMCRLPKISLVVAVLLSTPVVANAADVTRAALDQPYPIPIVYDWTAFYVGGHVGAGWIGGAGDGGFLGGGQAGFNYQFEWLERLNADELQQLADGTLDLAQFRQGDGDERTERLQ